MRDFGSRWLVDDMWLQPAQLLSLAEISCDRRKRPIQREVGN